MTTAGRVSPRSICLSLGAPQHGVFTAAQCAAQGVTPQMLSRLEKDGTIRRVERGIYVLNASSHTYEQRLVIAGLWLGPGSAVSHRAAGFIHGLDGSRGQLIEMCTTRKRQSKHGVLVHQTSRLAPIDLSSIDGMAVTSPARTLLDLGAVLPWQQVEIAFESAVRKGLVSLARLRWVLKQEGTKGRPGTATLRRLLDERPHGYVPTGSSLELEFAHFLRRRRFPAPFRQFEARNRGRVVLTCDFAYPERMLYFEVDSLLHHSGRQSLEKDALKRNEMASLGWRMIQVTYGRLRDDPDGLAREIRMMLGLSEGK